MLMWLQFWSWKRASFCQWSWSLWSRSRNLWSWSSFGKHRLD